LAIPQKKEDNETVVKEKVKGEDNETKEKASICTPTKHTNIRPSPTLCFYLYPQVTCRIGLKKVGGL